MSKQYSIDNKDWWDNLYQTERTPWDLSMAAPPLRSFLDSPHAVPVGSVAVVGCGAGHDCMLFAEYGFTVTGIDFAPCAVQATQKKFLEAGILGKRGFVLEQDIFNLHEHNNSFDYIVDHCFFCALHPSKRKAYAQAVAKLIKPQGKLIALFWTGPAEPGPPFGVAKEAVFEIFGDYFSFDLSFEPTNSAPSRQGHELFVLMTKHSK